MKHFEITLACSGSLLLGLLACTPIDTVVGSNAAGNAGKPMTTQPVEDPAGGRAQGGAPAAGGTRPVDPSSAGYGTGQGGTPITQQNGTGGSSQGQIGGSSPGQTGGSSQAGSSALVCPPNRNYLTPGCAPSVEYPNVVAGCYQRCASAEDSSCSQGQVCSPRSYDPCVCNDPSVGCCAACSMSTWVCMPNPSSCEDQQRSDMILSAENQFGMCLGQCRSKIQLNADPLGNACDGVSLVISDNQGTATPVTNLGRLTPLGHERARSLTLPLRGLSLESVYGCPDCADGGVTRIELAREGISSIHAFDYSAGPPTELAGVNGFVQALIQSLKTCTTSEYLDVIEGSCTPAGT